MLQKLMLHGQMLLRQFFYLKIFDPKLFLVPKKSGTKKLLGQKIYCQILDFKKLGNQTFWDIGDKDVFVINKAYFCVHK